jgi:hypothetical protein
VQKYNGQLIRQFASSVSGNAASGVTVTVRKQSDNSLATLYVDNNIAGATLSNPLTTSATGHFSFYAADDVYTLDFSDTTPNQVIQLQDVGELQSQFDAAVLNAGYIPSGTFTAGATLTQANQVLSDGSSYWRWDGSFPKVVGAGSSPAPTGVGGWILVSDQALRGDLSAADSTVLVGGVEAGRVGALNKAVNCLMFGGDATGVADSTAAIQAAVNYAIANNLPYHEAAGTYKVTSKVTLGRMVFKGAGHGLSGGGTTYVPTISDGTAVFEIPAGTNFFDIGGFRIAPALNKNDFISGAINGQNCIGLKIISTASYAARFKLSDILVTLCKTNFDINGFIGVFDNVWSIAGETGATLTNINACNLQFKFEECRKDFSITNSNGVVLENIICEGGAFQSGLAASTIDGCAGITINSPYWEQQRNVSFIRVGFTTQCYGITINGMTLAAADNASSDYNIALMEFDKVDGLFLLGQFSTGNHHNRYTTTSSTKNIIDNTTATSVDNFGPHDSSGNLSWAMNHFPNPNFDLWLRGWPNITITRATVTQETTLVRKGKNALRMTFTAAQSSAANVQFILNDAALTPAYLAGKTVSLYAWVWIPNTSDFNANDGSSQKIQPYLALITNGTGGTTTTTGTHHTMRGAWNLFKMTASVPSDCTSITAAFYMGLGSGTSSGSEYVVIDSMYLVEGNLGQTNHIVNGWVRDAFVNPVTCRGGKLEQYCTSVPTDADMTYEVGDKFHLLSVAAGGAATQVVTTAGTGATKVIKAINVSA